MVPQYHVFTIESNLVQGHIVIVASRVKVIVFKHYGYWHFNFRLICKQIHKLLKVAAGLLSHNQHYVAPFVKFFAIRGNIVLNMNN